MAGFENHIGKIDISESYLTEIVTHAVTDCFGVAGLCDISVFRRAVSTFTKGKAFRKNKGVLIRTGKDGGLIIELHIKVSYGTNITAAVKSIIHKVSFCVEEATELSVSRGDVFVDEMVA